MIVITNLKNIFFGVLLLISQNVLAQNRPHVIYNQTNGLLSNDVYGVAQDDRGYIWFTSKVGLTRFDGSEFIHYSVLDGLPTNFSWRLYHDSQDRIWLFNNLPPFTYIKNDTIYRVGDKIDNFYLQSIIEDSEGNIHFNQFNRGGNRFVYTTDNELVEKGENWYLYDNSENYYYYTRFEIVVKSKKDSTDIKKISHPYGAHHFTTSDNKIYFTQPAKFSVFDMKTEKVNLITNTILPNYYITINRYNNQVIVGTKEGYYTYDHHILKKVDSTLFISHVLIDKNGNEWLPTLGKGIFFYPKLKREVAIYPDNNMRDLFIDKTDTNIYFSNANSEFYSIKTHNKKLLANYNEINVLSKIIVLPNYNLFFKSDRLFVFNSTDFSNNSRLINAKDTTVKVLNGIEFLEGNGTRDYSILGDSILLATTRGLKLLIFENDSVTLKQLNSKKVLACKQTQKYILFGNETGLYTFENKIEKPLFKKEIIGGSIKTIVYSSHLNCFFVGTEQGHLYRINDQLDSIYTYNQLFNQIKHISIKNKDQILISTSNKLIEYDLIRETVSNTIGINNGLGSNDINEAYYFDSTYYISDNAGLAIINDKIDYTTNKIYPTLIKRISVDNKDLEINSIINIPTETKHLKIEFSNLTYWGNKDVRYEYRIKELNKSWISTKTPQVEYSNFPYGNYTFQLKTIGVDGVERKDVLELTLNKPSPFWLKVWFRILVVLLLITLVILVMRYLYLKKERKIKQEQEKQLLKHKTAMAEYKALRLQMNPHFLFNSLNAVQNSILDNDVERANAYLNDFATLMRQILHYSTKESIKLSEEIKLSKDYLNIEKNRYKNTIVFEISIEDNIDADSIMVPPMIFQPILENAIWHGIVPLNKNGKIVLLIHEEEEFIKVIISDNGVGYNQSISKPKSAKNRDSIAIQNTCDRLKLFNKSTQNKDKYITIANNKKQGTQVVMYIYKKHTYGL